MHNKSLPVIEKKTSQKHNVVIRDLFGSKKAVVTEKANLEEASSPSMRPHFLAGRKFSRADVHPYDEMKWVLRDGEIKGVDGTMVFSQKDLDFPEDWSLTAVNVVASKYFYGRLGEERREHSLKQLIDRVVDTITRWGLEDQYFSGGEEAQVFNDEMKWLLANQHASFNSPVWFNVGVEPHPQCSAYFINSVEDAMGSILDLAKTEGMLFKYGSGSGVNLSPLRSSKEAVAGGGSASGPVSFMRGFDAFAGVIKSGGKTRRAAKMVMLNVDHPDIKEFIESKSKEERKARALVELGYDSGIDGEAYSSVFFQNANHSVRVSDRFMDCVEQDRSWVTREVTTGKPSSEFQARDLLRLISENSHYCGDPGLQFDDTINRWHTCPNSGRINGSNPCSEYMFLDDTACNLASLNLMKFVDEEGDFQSERLAHAVDLLILSQEIIISRASYPTPKIGDNSEKYRPLGLGYANLGAMLMSLGLPYDSDKGRYMAGAITALMTGEAYRMSGRIAAVKGPFAAYKPNRSPMLSVIRLHRAELDKLDPNYVHPDLLAACQKVWDQALNEGERNGFRNAQTTVLAPTGTIGFMMDCDTTGVEPDISLVKFKKLVGGGMMKIVNQSVRKALRCLGYDEEAVERIVDDIATKGTIEAAEDLKPEHLPVFDCALTPNGGKRSIHYKGHLKMLGAVQPFISGSISKTVNVPTDTDVDEIYDIYSEAWKMGIKAVSIYRDGSKVMQPLSTSEKEEKRKEKEEPKALRTRLPDERRAVTHKFSIDGHEGYITVGMYEDGSPGEVFITMAKQGSTVSGLMDSFATSISIALQYGVPLATLVHKFTHLRFEPSGFTNNRDIPMAKSVMDYIFRWMASKFLNADGTTRTVVPEDKTSQDLAGDTIKVDQKFGALVNEFLVGNGDAPSCHACGDVMVRNGSCYKCSTCGETSGCS